MGGTSVTGVGNSDSVKSMYLGTSHLIESKIEQKFDDYKKFALNRNMIQIVVGLILASGFQKVITGISDFAIMPMVNYFLNSSGKDWRAWIVHPVDGMNIEIGHLIGVLIDFVILTVFLYLLWTKVLKRMHPDLEIYPEKKPT